MVNVVAVPVKAAPALNIMLYVAMMPKKQVAQKYAKKIFSKINVCSQQVRLHWPRNLPELNMAIPVSVVMTPRVRPVQYSANMIICNAHQQTIKDFMSLDLKKLMPLGTKTLNTASKNQYVHCMEQNLLNLVLCHHGQMALELL